MSDAAPSSFETLGLPAHADEVMVRRAYARLLRATDPGLDPGAFQHLREAYEAALAWCEAHPHVDEADEAVSAKAPDPVVAPTEAPAAPAQDEAAQEALRRLGEAASQDGGDMMGRWLDEALASLRFGYIDAPGQFEDLLIDALRTQRIQRRAALFDASTRAFHWHEVGRRRSSDARAGWIARVLAQREQWHALDAGWRDTWVELLARAQHGLDDYVVRRWPDIGRLRERVPDWVALYLAPAQLDAWQSAFEHLPATTRREYTQRAAPASATVPGDVLRATQRKRFRMPPTAWAISWFVLMLAYLIGNGVFMAQKQQAGEPLPRLNETPLTPRECMALYAHLDAPDAFANMAPDEVTHAKRRAQRCALDGHWRAPGGGSDVPGG